MRKSKNKTEVRICPTNKYCYASEAAAQRALNEYPDLTRYYECDKCGYYHCTSSKRHNLKEEVVKKRSLVKHLNHIIFQKTQSLEKRKKDKQVIDLFFKKNKLIKMYFNYWKKRNNEKIT